ncbi:MAG TPA: LysM domain-containing protein [Chthoniobacterales bacterium]|jgi:LysM domain.|nr:LysM domain-containing protein [Chthoniobacterales bacterium]
MKSVAAGVWSALALLGFAGATSFAQTFAPSPNPAASQAAQLQELTKKIDEQNAKIDMLSQQILKLQLEMSHQRPGVMIGDASASSTSPSTTTATSTSSPAASTAAGSGNSHVVARGETLTSIAKMYSVSVSDLQKFNHIDNPLKLMAGQTLQIPPSPIPSPSSSGE